MLLVNGFWFSLIIWKTDRNLCYDRILKVEYFEHSNVNIEFNYYSIKIENISIKIDKKIQQKLKQKK